MTIGDSRLTRSLRLLARPLEVVLGVTFVVSALLKALDVNGFIGAIGNYHVLPSAVWEGYAAMATLGVETFLGVSMLLGMGARRLTLGVTTLVLVVFSGLIVYAWMFHGLKDCGCTGGIKMGPVASLVKNALLLTLAVGAWQGFKWKNALDVSGAVRGKAFMLASLGAAFIVGYGVAESEPPPPPIPRESGVFSQFSVEQDGVRYDLGQGEYVVALLSTTCDHCMKSVEALNALLERPGFPRVVGLCKGDEASLERFRTGTAPEYPTGIVAEFPLALIGQRLFDAIVPVAPPRFIYVRDGREIKAWDDVVPSPEEVEALRPTGPPHPASVP